jgi:hypothetical protein
MADKVKTDNTYQVGTGDVFLSLSIGEGQFGTSDVLLGGTKLVRASGSIGSLRIGSGPDIKGKKLVARSAVNDVSTMTNKMSVTYRLDGGKSQKALTAKGSVGAQGKLLIFETTFSLG